MATISEFNEEIRMSLGGNCLVDVELVDEDYALCFKKAKRIFKQQGHNNFRRVFTAIEVVEGTREYDVPATTADVVTVIRPSVGFSSGDDVFNSLVYDQLMGDYGMGGDSCTCGSFDMLSYELTKQRMEMMDRYSANEIEFHYDKFRKKITFFGTPRPASRYFVDMYLDLDDDEYREVDWIVRWAIAEAKQVLGTAYDKFQTLPSPQGETNLGGDKLRQEAQEEKTRLLEEILEYVDGDIDFVGIRFG